MVFVQELNVGFSLDEGIAAPGEEIPIFYGERNVFWVRITCPGSPGHGSRFLENTAAEKVTCVAFLFEGCSRLSTEI
jgi:aminoacylase